MSTFTNMLSSLGESFKTQVARFNNKDFATGVVYVCALISAADKSIDAGERKRTAQAFNTNELLASFDKAALRQQYDDACDELIKDFDMVSIDMLTAIGKLRKDPDQAKAAIRIGILIAKAEGGVSPEELQVIKDICREVKIDPSEVGIS